MEGVGAAMSNVVVDASAPTPTTPAQTHPSSMLPSHRQH
jgi:hypothetical protein